MAQSRHHIERSGLSIAAVAKLIGISPSSLKAALRDEGPLSGEKELELFNATSKLLAYANALTPLLLPREWQLLQEIIGSPVTPGEVESFVSRIFISKDN